MSFRIREYHPVDTDYVLELWDKAKSDGYQPVYSNSQSEGPSTDDYLWAVADTRMTVSSEMAGQFLEDIENLARL